MWGEGKINILKLITGGKIELNSCFNSEKKHLGLNKMRKSYIFST